FRVYRSLRRADVVERVREPDITRPEGYRPTFRLLHDIPEDFALNQTLSPFALAAMDLVDPLAAGHALDVVSVIEATLENPRQVLIAQEKAARGRAIAEMKADGLEYDERMALLEEVTYPRPLAEVLEPAFAMYVRTNPWVAGEELKPKSVVRELLETADTFTDYVARYGLERSEGVLLRYLADAYRALRQVVPAEHRTEEIAEIVEWLGELVRGVDSTLLDEWEKLAHPEAAARAAIDAQEAREDETLRAVTGNAAAWRRLVRNAMYRLVELSSREDYAALAAAAGGDWTADTLADALDPLFVEQGDEAINTGANARGPALFSVLETSATAWQVRQVFDDYDGHHDWAIWATVDLPASDAADEVVLTVDRIGPIELGTAA
ncbi:MAG: DUF3516 domain-containing protein, partial [Promicromonosporaceae bacterium]|nr:DUF3516 domain-containing protein [Promicromonosporaceae bacterium]